MSHNKAFRRNRGFNIINLNNIDEKEFSDMGSLVLHELNINLFNATPRLQKIHQLYKELQYNGIEESSSEVVYGKINYFFKHRTVKNQKNLFFKIFKLHYTDEIRVLFSLSFKTAEIRQDQISQAASRVNEALLKIDLRQYGVDIFILSQAIAECFCPKYFEDEWKVSILQLALKVKYSLQAAQRTDFITEIEEIFQALSGGFKPKAKTNKTPNSKKDLSLINESAKDLGTGEYRVIKDSEVVFIKKILEKLKNAEIGERLECDIFDSKFRHPLVTTFLGLVKNYNRILNDQETPFRDLLTEIKATTKAMKETGDQVIQVHESHIQKNLTLAI